MYLSKLTLQNFESYEEAEILLHPGPGITSLIGDSDTGKSGILRSLDLLFFNQPPGDEYRSDWGGDTRVKGFFTDGSTLERIRSSSLNAYVLNDGPELTGFGRGNVPEEVEEFLRMNEINIMRQFDPIFMVQWLDSRRGEFINDLCNFSKIETSLSEIGRIYKEEKQIKDQAKFEIDDYKEKLEAIPDLDPIREQIEYLEGLQEKIEDLEDDVDQVEEDLDNLARLVRQMKAYNEILKYKGEVSRLSDIASKIEMAKAEMDEIESMLDDVQEDERRIKSLSTEIDKLEKQFHREFPDQCPLCGKGKE